MFVVPNKGKNLLKAEKSSSTDVGGRDRRS